MTSKGRLALLFPIFLVSVCGCTKVNPNVAASVSGKVTYQGKPVPAGTVNFYGKTNYFTSIRPDGTYSQKDMSIDQEFTVTIETESVNPQKQQSKHEDRYAGAKAASSPKAFEEMMRKKKGGGEGPAPPAREYIKIPAKYASDKTSGLKVTLQKGEQTKNFDLTD